MKNFNVQFCWKLVFPFIIILWYNEVLSQQLITNPAHLNHLYQEIIVNGVSMGIVHIYSEYPDYHWVGDSDEGIACVDDAARAAIFFKEYYLLTKDSSSLEKVKALTEFLLYMQSESGWFYNFIWDDYSINKTFKTSIAIPNWWTWRAFWALTENYWLIKENNTELAERMLQASQKLVLACKNEFSIDEKVINIDGFRRPLWLPFQSASDQAAVLVLGLINYYKISGDKSVLPIIERMCDGIIMMQEGDESNFPHGAFLSWQNIWHAYGNSQSYALLKAYEVLKNNKYKDAALYEINNFYDYLIEQKFLNEFILDKMYGITIVKEMKIFPQIAYGIRPMVFASLKAYELENDKKYLDKALKIASWLFGNNYSTIRMYNKSNGICYDGLTNIDEVNMNSGAESTIEALLTLVKLEKYRESAEFF